MRSGKKTIDLSLLSQTQPSVYHLDTGDVLAISIEGVMPRREGELPPVNMSFNANDESLPALGYPVPVRSDGTVSLPMLHDAVSVRGMTVKQAEDGSGDMIVRCYESSGGRRTATLHTAFATSDVTVCDFLERPLAEESNVAGFDGSAITLSLRPFQIVTLRLSA